MKKIVVCCIALMCFSGCSWFVPTSIKREVSLMRVDIQTAKEEVAALEGDAAKQKALRTLERLEPHVVNLDNYCQGKKAER